MVVDMPDAPGWDLTTQHWVSRAIPKLGPPETHECWSAAGEIDASREVGVAWTARGSGNKSFQQVVEQNRFPSQ